MTIDIAIIVAYCVVINIIGLKYAGSSSIDDYFLGNRSVNWIIVSFSIVATETSSLTFLSVPGLAYVKGMGFLQIAFGYLVGRILVALLLLPGYFEGDMDTVYQFLQKRFSITSRKAVSVIFHITRLLADSVRLFATAIPLTFLMGWDYRISLLVIGVATFVYTFFGGIKSVIIVDTLQLFLYLFSVALGIYFVAKTMSCSIGDVFAQIAPGDLSFISSGAGGGWRHFFNSYNIVSGIIGGAFLSFASHGTDHIIVQRALTCKDVRSAQKAMIISGVFIIFQFALFLLFGLFLKVLMNGRVFAISDEIVPLYIIQYLPPGVRGIMLMGIFAAAMSTLSSSVNSLSSSTVIDFLGLREKHISAAKKVALSRGVSLLWTVVIIGISMLFKDSKNPLVEIGLSIASITYGGMLGIFLTGRFIKGVSDFSALAGVFVSIAVMGVIAFTTTLFWLWYVALGFVIAVSVTAVAHYLGMRIVR